MKPNTDPLRSAQPCGCDAGASYTCDWHTVQIRMANELMAKEERAIMGETAEEKTWKIEGIQDSGKRVTYASGSMRDPSEGKIKWSRILFGPMARRWAWHLTKAEAKYPDAAPGVPNFTLISTDEEFYRYKESALRHFMSWYYDEKDEDHASAVFFNINGVEIIKEKNAAPKVEETVGRYIVPSFERCKAVFPGQTTVCSLIVGHVGDHKAFGGHDVHGQLLSQWKKDL